MTSALSRVLGIILVMTGVVHGQPRSKEILPRDIVTIRAEGITLVIADGVPVFRERAGIKLQDFENPPDGSKQTKAVSNFFRFSEGYLRVYLTSSEAGFLKRHDDCNGKYICGDYTTDPPSLILCEKPEKNVHWLFSQAPGADQDDVGHLRNVNDEGKEAWLFWTEDGPLSLAPGGGSVMRLRQPILSYERKPWFSVRSYGSKVDRRLDTGK